MQAALQRGSVGVRQGLTRAARVPARAPARAFSYDSPLAPLGVFPRVDTLPDLRKELQRFGIQDMSEPAMRIDFAEVRACAARVPGYGPAAMFCAFPLPPDAAPASPVRRNARPYRRTMRSR